MQIFFKSTKLEKIFNSEKNLIKEYGKEQAGKIKVRLKVLQAAANLEEISTQKPERRHQLDGNRKNQFAVDLVHPFRLIFMPNEPIELKEDGGIDLKKVFRITILEVEDYHGKK